MNEKEQLIANVKASEGISNQIAAKEDEVQKYMLKIQQFRKNTGGEATGKRVLWFIFVWIWLLCGFIPLLITLFLKSVAFLGSFLAIAWVALMVYVYFVMPFQTKKKLKQAEEELETLRHSPQLDWLPYEYRTGSCINAIVSYLQSGRVDSMKEALNLLENEIHQQRMEDAAAVGAYYGAQSGRY